MASHSPLSHPEPNTRPAPRRFRLSRWSLWVILPRLEAAVGAEAAAEDRDASPLPPPPPPQIGDRLPQEPAVGGAPEEFHPLPFHHPAGGAVIDSQHASAEKTSSDPATAGPHVIEEADGKAVDRALEAEAEVLLGGLMEAASTGPGTRGGARWRLISYGLLEVLATPRA